MALNTLGAVFMVLVVPFLATIQAHPTPRRHQSRAGTVHSARRITTDSAALWSACYGGGPMRQFHFQATLATARALPTVLWSTSPSAPGGIRRSVPPGLTHTRPGRPMTWSNSPCVVQCVNTGLAPGGSVASLDTVVCGYTAACTTPSPHPHPRPHPVIAPFARQPSQPAAVVSYHVNTGHMTFNSTQLPDSATTPIALNFDPNDKVVITTSATVQAMAVVGVDGTSFGAPIDTDLSGAGPPAVTQNGVVAWPLQRGTLSAYLVNGVPHASIGIPSPRTIMAVGGPTGNSLFVAGVKTTSSAMRTTLDHRSDLDSTETCVVVRIDVARTMNSRLVQVWERPVPCPHPSSTYGSPNNLAPLTVVGDLVVLAGDGGADNACLTGATVLSVTNGSQVAACIPTDGAPVTAMAARVAAVTARGNNTDSARVGAVVSTVWMAVPATRALWVVRMGGDDNVNVDINVDELNRSCCNNPTVQRGQALTVQRVNVSAWLDRGGGGDLVGPIAVLSDGDAVGSDAVQLVALVQTPNTGAVRVTSAVYDATTALVTHLWDVVLDGVRGTDNTTQYGITSAESGVAPPYKQRLIVTVGGTVFAVGLRNNTA
eukprot:m.176360 g.176360  ORF g.176360 m.176360 type:complete len:600 (-) comp14151_c0_seq1:39-1838(-)